jgi:hypothetical protein
MNYEDALKKVQAKKVKDNFMLISFGYDMKIVLPHKEGMAFITSLQNAEQLEDPYSGQHRITGLDRSRLSIHIMSHDEYERIKIAAILGINPKDIEEQMKTKPN